MVEDAKLRLCGDALEEIWRSSNYVEETGEAAASSSTLTMSMMEAQDLAVMNRSDSDWFNLGPAVSLTVNTTMPLTVQVGGATEANSHIEARIH